MLTSKSFFKLISITLLICVFVQCQDEVYNNYYNESTSDTIILTDTVIINDTVTVTDSLILVDTLYDTIYSDVSLSQFNTNFIKSFEQYIGGESQPFIHFIHDSINGRIHTSYIYESYYGDFNRLLAKVEHQHEGNIITYSTLIEFNNDYDSHLIKNYQSFNFSEGDYHYTYSDSFFITNTITPRQIEYTLNYNTNNQLISIADNSSSYGATEIFKYNEQKQLSQYSPNTYNTCTITYEDGKPIEYNNGINTIYTYVYSNDLISKVSKHNNYGYIYFYTSEYTAENYIYSMYSNDELNVQYIFDLNQLLTELSVKNWMDNTITTSIYNTSGEITRKEVKDFYNDELIGYATMEWFDNYKKESYYSADDELLYHAIITENVQSEYFTSIDYVYYDVNGNEVSTYDISEYWIVNLQDYEY